MQLLVLTREGWHRFQRGSEMCQKLAQALHHLTMEEERALFDFGSRAADESPLVLILDRKDDPVTPMLLQWTYQAMVHELLGISNNLVSLKDAPGVSRHSMLVLANAQSAAHAGQPVLNILNAAKCIHATPRCTRACSWGRQKAALN